MMYVSLVLMKIKFEAFAIQEGNILTFHLFKYVPIVWIKYLHRSFVCNHYQVRTLVGFIVCYLETDEFKSRCTAIYLKDMHVKILISDRVTN